MSSIQGSVVSLVNRVCKYQKITFFNVFSLGRLYSTKLHLKDIEQYKGRGGNFSKSPWFISGLVDAEGTFVIIIRKAANYRLGWRVEAVFRIGFHKRDLALLEQIQAYFGGVGSIVRQGQDFYAYRVSSLKHILIHILPHFDQFPLISKKRADYLLWREVILILKSGEHLSYPSGIRQVLKK